MTIIFGLERTLPIPPIGGDSLNIVNTVPAITYPYSKVTPVSAKAVYYTINISAFGYGNNKGKNDS